MKYQKLIDQLNTALETASRKSQKHQETLKFFIQQFQTEEQNLLRKLEEDNSKSSRKKLKKDLGTVKKAYDLLGVNA